MSRNQRATRPRGSTASAQRPAASQRVAGDRSPRRGPHIGPVRITPVRLTLALAMVGGLAFLAYSVFVRDVNQVLVMALGFATCGLVLGIVAVLSIGRIVSAGREGRDGTAVVSALLGGLMAAAAMLLLAGAVIMFLIWSGTHSA